MISTEELLNSILESMEKISSIQYEDIPNIDLYMDQVTTFMDEKLQSSTRNPGEDKILTKTMINNYAKNDLLPPPVKKKYSREHMMILILIYYMKGVISLNDIQELLTPITGRYFQSAEAFNLECIYKELLNIEDSRKESLKKDVTQKLEYSQMMFQGAPKEEREFFILFALIAQLGFDVYAKRLMIERLIDGFRAENALQPEVKNNKSKKKEPKTE